MKSLIFLVFFICSCEKEMESPVFHKDIYSGKSQVNTTEATVQAKKEPVHRLVLSARKQIGITTSYDPAYRKLTYPGGDVPTNTGVCTDVIIRALRDAEDVDLQKLVHEDMKRAFHKYPNIWGLRRPDKNIGHRRVPNLQCYFERKGYKVKTGKLATDFKAGDIVTCMVGNRPHIMIVSNRTLKDTPLVIHNIGSGTKEDNSLFSFKITGQYRFKK